jgi:yeast amino acid transporter
VSRFLTCYIGIAVYVFNIFMCKVLKKTKRVKAHEMDLVSGRREFEELEARAQAEEMGKPSFRERLRSTVDKSEHKQV